MVTLHTVINNHNYIRHYTSSAIGYQSVSTSRNYGTHELALQAFVSVACAVS